MPVQTAQLHMLAIQMETLRRETRLAKSDARAELVCPEFCDHRIELRILQAPQLTLPNPVRLISPAAPRADFTTRSPSRSSTATGPVVPFTSQRP